MQRANGSQTEGLAEADKENALDRIPASENFASAGRTREFLAYVVAEDVAGRGGDIRGKTIAEDVYERDPTDAGDPLNIVRVEARRLRQSLELYYETDGRDDAVRIYIDRGQYGPRYERLQPATDDTVDRESARVGIMLATFIAGALFGSILATVALNDVFSTEVSHSPDNARDAKTVLERQAVLEKSAAALQAVNLAEQARGMIFPIFDRHRQELMGSVFERVIELDSEYFGGFAGVAQTAATLAILTINGGTKTELLNKANYMAARAISLEPTDPWAQSAAAWVKMAMKDYDQAYRLSERAAQLGGNDGHVLDFHGTIALFSGNFEEAVKSADRKHSKGGSNQRYANRNILGAASFHLGNFRQSYDAFQAAAQFGDPLSAPSVAYQAAALNALGDKTAARSKVTELKRSWPNAPLDKMLYAIHSKKENADAVLSHLINLGWILPTVD